ncbi:hypothetical protein [Kordiimonas aestuarii]|uniref:hypothetical protein n=1 Tax=Kordiimonas aestuarii TaxID=1005925 RepID=UPI0021D05294|nr:hypothetical protein [Kordiimonas aestuarii]
MKTYAPLVLAIALGGCVTIDQVRTASNIIKLDNDLQQGIQQRIRHRQAEAHAQQIPTDKRDPAGVQSLDFVNLADIGNQAANKAQKLAAESDTLPEALSYYRIAAMAYWQSYDPSVNTALGNVVEDGKALCQKMGENSPDRDCFLLPLIPPYAGYEETRRSMSPGGSSLFSGINMADGATQQEARDLTTIADALVGMKAAVTQAYKVATDFGGVPDNIKAYYCSNTNRMAQAFLDSAGVYLAMVETYWGAPSGTQLPITVDQATRQATPAPASNTYTKACEGT